MCTAVMHLDCKSVQVVMNRDERHERADEIPPEVLGTAVRAAYPRDGQRGGTWIGTNEQGLTAFLLNAYAPSDKQLAHVPSTPSRGELIPKLLEYSYNQAIEWLDNVFVPDCFPSFTLVLAEAGRAKSHMWAQGEWSTYEHSTGWHVFSSSSWNQGEVLPWRKAQFEKWQQGGCQMDGLLPTFSTTPVAGMEAWSPMMERSYSATRSVTRVCCDGEQAQSTLEWWSRTAGALSASAPSVRLHLPLNCESRRNEPVL